MFGSYFQTSWGKNSFHHYKNVDTAVNFFCTHVFICTYLHNVTLYSHVEFEFESRSSFMGEIPIPHLWVDICKCPLAFKSVENKIKTNNENHSKTKTLFGMFTSSLTCSHWSFLHKMSHLAKCICHIHGTCYWQILPVTWHSTNAVLYEFNFSSSSLHALSGTISKFWAMYLFS